MARRRFFSPWLVKAICSTMVLPMTGCTYALWAPAFETHAVQPEIAGLMRNYPKPGDQGLVVTYRAQGDGTDVNLFVPVDQDYYPVSPFRPIGAAYLIKCSNDGPNESVAGRLSSDQMTAILSHAARPAAQRDSLQNHFTATDWSPAVGTGADRPTGIEEHPGTVWMLAYKMNSSGQLVPLSIKAGTNSDPITLPDGARLVLVPGMVDRPPGDQTRDQIVAVALTPVSVACDAAGTGLAIGFVGAVIGTMPVWMPIAIVAAASTSGNSQSAPAKQETAPVEIPVNPPDVKPQNQGVTRINSRDDLISVAMSARGK